MINCEGREQGESESESEGDDVEQRRGIGTVASHRCAKAPGSNSSHPRVCVSVCADGDPLFVNNNEAGFEMEDNRKTNYLGRVRALASN